MATKSKMVRDIVRKLAATDSRREHAELKLKLETKVRELFDMVDSLCHEIGTEPPWLCLIDAMDADKTRFEFKSDSIYTAELSCYGTEMVDVFMMTASDGTLENEIPIELPWFDLGESGWREKLVSSKREKLEKDVAAAQIKLQLAQDRLMRFNEKQK